MNKKFSPFSLKKYGPYVLPQIQIPYGYSHIQYWPLNYGQGGHPITMMPPPFFRPINPYWNQSREMSFGNQKRLCFFQKIKNYSYRSNLKAPTERKLIHFMPLKWQKKWKNKNREELSYEQFKKEKQSKKSPEKANRDTIKRRARRQKIKQRYETGEYTIGQLENNRFHLLDNSDDNNPEVEHILPNENRRTTMDNNQVQQKE